MSNRDIYDKLFALNLSYGFMVYKDAFKIQVYFLIMVIIFNENNTHKASVSVIIFENGIVMLFI